MSSITLDQIILHYVLRERKFMMDLSKSVRADYFEPEYRLFFAHLHGAFLDPNIKEVLSLPAFVNYVGAKLHSDSKNDLLKSFKEVYTSALNLKVEGKALPASDFTYFLQKFKERFNAVIVKQAANNLLGSIENKDDVKILNKIVSETSREISSINKARIFDEGSLGEDIVNIYQEYLAIKDRPEQFRGISSGIPSLDMITKGWHGGELIIIAGFEGSGKSLLCMQFAVNAWIGSNDIHMQPSDYKNDGKNVIYFSLEMPRSNRGEVTMGAYLNKRMTSCISGVDFSRLRDGTLADDEVILLKTACKFIKKYDNMNKLYVVDIPRGATVDDIEVKYLEIIEKFPVDMIIIDYLGLMKGMEGVSDWESQGNIASGLHELARVYNVPIISPVQVNRPQGNNHSLNKQNYNTTRLARASGIGQNANVVLQIGQRDNEHTYDDMPLHLIKARDGAKGELTLRKEFSKMRIYDGQNSDDSMDEIIDLIDVGDYNENSNH